MLKHLRLSIIGIVSLCCGSLVASCDKDMSIALDNNNIESLTVNTVDSMTAQVSTVLLPHIPTSGSGKSVVGRSIQPIIGSISASTYFPLELEQYTNTFPAGARFDSIHLVLAPHNSRYSYGDTTVVQKISIHRVTEELVTTTLTSGQNLNSIPVYVQQPSIFADQKFNYEASPLGELTYSARPSRGTNLSIRLDDTFGKDLFDKMRSNTFEVSSQSNFREYLKGIVIVPDENNTCLVAFNDSVYAHINYSFVDSDGLRKSESKRMLVRDFSRKYTHFDSDRTGTAFENLSLTTPIKSSASNGVSYAQGAVGVGSRITIPSLKEFMHLPDIAINKAELEIEVSTAGSALYPSPASGILFVVDGTGVPINFISVPFTPTIQQVRYVPGNSTGRNGKYVFNLIEYIRTVNDPLRQDFSLVFAPSSSELFDTGNAAIIATENNKPNIKLNIVYTKFR